MYFARIVVCKVLLITWSIIEAMRVLVVLKWNVRYSLIHIQLEFGIWELIK